MHSMSGSCRNLAALAQEGGDVSQADLRGGGPLSLVKEGKTSGTSLDSSIETRQSRWEGIVSVPGRRVGPWGGGWPQLVTRTWSRTAQKASDTMCSWVPCTPPFAEHVGRFPAQAATDLPAQARQGPPRNLAYTERLLHSLLHSVYFGGATALTHLCATCADTHILALTQTHTRARIRRLVFVSNHLPIRASKGSSGWQFEWDEDALITQAAVRIATEGWVAVCGMLVETLVTARVCTSQALGSMGLWGVSVWSQTQVVPDPILTNGRWAQRPRAAPTPQPLRLDTAEPPNLTPPVNPPENTQEGVASLDAAYVGCLSVDIPYEEQDEVARELEAHYRA